MSIRSLKFNRNLFGMIWIILGYWATSNTFNNILEFVFICFAFFIFYSGLYILNDIIDYKYDQKSKIKRKRIHKPSLLLIVIACFIIAMPALFSYIISKVVFYYFALFVIINLFYSFFFKHVPYLEIFINAITHPLRFFLGVSMNTAFFSIDILLAGITIYFFMLIFLIGRRRHEMAIEGNLSRHTLKYYKQSGLKYFHYFIMVLFFIETFIITRYYYLSYMLFFISTIFVLKNKSKKVQSVYAIFD